MTSVPGDVSLEPSSTNDSEGSKSCSSPSPRVLSIQSSVVHGYVGNKAAVLPLQLMGFDVDPINTVELSNHTGYKIFKGKKHEGEHLSTLLSGLKANGLLSHSHLLTGYIGSVSFLKSLITAVSDLKSSSAAVSPSSTSPSSSPERPPLTYVCDPVLGDGGRLYVPQEFVALYRDELIPHATVVTPNQTEAELLTGKKITDLRSAFAACCDFHAKGVRTVVITSLESVPSTATSSSNEEVITVFATDVSNQPDSNVPSHYFVATIKKLDRYVSGCGDLFTALLLAWLHRHPHDIATALSNTLSSVNSLVRATCEAESKELLLIKHWEYILRPTVRIPVEKRDAKF